MKIARMKFMKPLTWVIVVIIFIIGVVPNVDAGFAPSEILTPGKFDREADMQGIQKILETKIVRERLAVLGFTQDEITTRLSQLSDRQLHQLALKIDNLKVGGDSGLGVVIALLVIAILVVLLLQMTGHKVIVK